VLALHSLFDQGWEDLRDTWTLQPVLRIGIVLMAIRIRIRLSISDADFDQDPDPTLCLTHVGKSDFLLLFNIILFIELPFYILLPIFLVSEIPVR